MKPTSINTVTSMLLQAINFAISAGFNPIHHTDIDDNDPANFHETLYNLINQITQRIEQGINYAAIYFNDDEHAFALEEFKTHNEMVNEFNDDEGNIPNPLTMASFTRPLKPELTMFTLEIILG